MDKNVAKVVPATSYEAFNLSEVSASQPNLSASSLHFPPCFILAQISSVFTNLMLMCSGGGTDASKEDPASLCRGGILDSTLVMAALCNVIWQAIIFLPCGFYLLFIYFFLA